MSYNLFEIYPDYDHKDDYPLYFIEFLQWHEGDPIHWKLYKRHFILPKEEYQKYIEEEVAKSSSPEEKENCRQMMALMREGHPWWLFDGELPPCEGTVPDKKWLLWMVDALNAQVQNELTTVPKPV